jgi:hypothetical protein
MAWYFIFLNVVSPAMVGCQDRQVARVGNSHPASRLAGLATRTRTTEVTPKPALTAGLVAEPAVG